MHNEPAGCQDGTHFLDHSFTTPPRSTEVTRGSRPAGTGMSCPATTLLYPTNLQDVKQDLASHMASRQHCERRLTQRWRAWGHHGPSPEW